MITKKRRVRGPAINKSLIEEVIDDYEVRGVGPTKIVERRRLAHSTVCAILHRHKCKRGSRVPSPAFDILPHEQAQIAWRAAAHPAQRPPPDPWST